MRTRNAVRRGAFTLIELLVVVAIIALLISILLPSLTCARENARAAKCGVQLRGLGIGLGAYQTEYSGWFPGTNTTGLRTIIASGDAAALGEPSMPVQNWDWITPLAGYDTELPWGRGKRWQFLFQRYTCPSFNGITIDELYSAGLSASPDATEIQQNMRNNMQPSSYLMPAHFQYWGYELRDVVLQQATVGGRPFAIKPRVQPTFFTARHKGQYRSRIEEIGSAARKVMAADGMRLVSSDKQISLDPDPDATYFGAFTSNGAWWAGAEAYGVKSPSQNWDGSTINAGDEPDAQGEGLVYSYRHGCEAGKLVRTAQENRGSINAMFFDGHVARLDDRQSREIEFWYPKGTIVDDASQGMRDVPDGFEVP